MATSNRSSDPAPRLLTRRRFLATAAIGAAATGLYTWRVEPHWEELVFRDLPIANLPSALIGKTLVQVSDLHIGPRVSDDYLRRVFARITELQPDLMVHTGDLVTYAGPYVIDQARRVLETFPQGKLGTIAILGNHDYGENWADAVAAHSVAHALRQAGCTVLRNTYADFAGLRVIGLDDIWAGQFSPFQALHDLRPEKPAIVLSHNPDTCDLPGWGNYRGWILAGHTHGGQCKPPFLPPPLLPVRNRRYVAGEYALEAGRQLYINRGVGHLLEVRFNVRPEVTVFRLTVA